MINADNAPYYQFTGPQRIDTAMHTLEGILHGIGIDGRLSAAEVRALMTWLEDYAEHAKKHPFDQVIEQLSAAVLDGHISAEEHKDLLWLCEKFRTNDTFYDAITSDIQRLHGVILGITADDAISELELRNLQEWLDAREELRGCWPYDELQSLIVDTLRDGQIDSREHAAMLNFMSTFVERSGHRSVADAAPQIDEFTVGGVCAVDPSLYFPDRLFCFTGKSARATRRDIEVAVLKAGGRCVDRVTGDLDYLVVGADGNRCWAYACYGRKVEEAVKLRKAGHRLLIVNELDFWDAMNAEL